MPPYAETDEDDETDHAQAMIDWLGDKDPDGWFEVSHHLNWDSSERVLDWIVSQPQCDKANAAFIFWGANPLWYLPRIGTPEHRDYGGFALIEKILKNWKAGFYTRAELAWTEDNRDKYQRVLAGIWGKRDPLAIPPALLAPWTGRKPKVPKALRAENNQVLNRLFYNLGTANHDASRGEAMAKSAAGGTARRDPRQRHGDRGLLLARGALGGAGHRRDGRRRLRVALDQQGCAVLKRAAILTTEKRPSPARSAAAATAAAR
jgi:hypothetical protein